MMTNLESHAARQPRPLGDGGGDFRLHEAPGELKEFIDAVIGSWAGDRVVFSGDYTTTPEHQETNAAGDETFTDISDKTAIALLAMVTCQIMQNEDFDAEDANEVKNALFQFLAKNVNVGECNSWGKSANIKSVLDAIDDLMTRRIETKESGDQSDEPTSAKKMRMVKPASLSRPLE